MSRTKSIICNYIQNVHVICINMYMYILLFLTIPKWGQIILPWDPTGAQWASLILCKDLDQSMVDLRRRHQHGRKTKQSWIIRLTVD